MNQAILKFHDGRRIPVQIASEVQVCNRTVTNQFGEKYKKLTKMLTVILPDGRSRRVKEERIKKNNDGSYTRP